MSRPPKNPGTQAKSGNLGLANDFNYRGYSAHEHTVLYSNLTSTALPQDIIIETLVSVLIVSIGLVLGAQKLKPISWREWAGEIERDGGARNPYLSLEERYGFWDIRVSLISTLMCILPELHPDVDL